MHGWPGSGTVSSITRGEPVRSRGNLLAGDSSSGLHGLEGMHGWPGACAQALMCDKPRQIFRRTAKP